MSERSIVVIGAGMGGLGAAIDLAARGFKVSLLERHPDPGGKMHTLPCAAAPIDSGPTVFTMRYVFEDLFRLAGAELSKELTLLESPRLARHFWSDGSRLDLYADVERSASAIEAFSNAREAEAYRQFADESEAIFNTLDHSFMRREKPGSVELAMSLGISGMPKLLATRPFTSLWKALGKRFNDPRLQQLFGRYATYCGSSPLQAPATLMLIAHAERNGVWHIQGGMQKLASAMAGLAENLGVEIHYSSEALSIATNKGRVSGINLADDAFLAADAVVFNGDVAALQNGLLGEECRKAVPARNSEPRSLSAVTWSLLTQTQGVELDHHTVFFGDHYEDEFHQIFDHQSVTEAPTVYICAQDRGAAGPFNRNGQKERLLMLINAPSRPFSEPELDELESRVFSRLQNMGLGVERRDGSGHRSSPNDFARRFPATEGAIYGWPTHGWQGSFKRWGSRSRLPGLYLAGGTVHPGPGIPMATLSGRIAAARIAKDLG